MFRDWLSAPCDVTSPHPRFEIRRATPDDFGRVFELVDSVFEARRKRSAYEWLYLGNPVGIARCWLVIERSSGEVVSSEARLPWPVAHGTELLEGEFVADSVVVPRLQRQGVFRLKAEAREAHPWSNRTIALSAPNERSIGALAKMGRQRTVLGPLPCATLLLDSARYLRSRSWPRAIAGILGGAAGLTLRSIQAMNLPAPPNVRIEDIGRFDSSVDELTFECGNASGYWCPHRSEFLNWRYFDNPGNSYMAQAAVVNQRLVGYSVIRLGCQQATLMEFSVSPATEFSAGALLRATAAAARYVPRVAWESPQSWKASVENDGR
jgi:hypothetical protein